MADNFDMKKFLVENQTGPYAKAKVKEEKLAEGEVGEDFNKKVKDFISKHINIIKDAAKFYKNQDESYEYSLIETIYNFLEQELGADWTTQISTPDPEDEKEFTHGWTDDKDEVFYNTLKSVLSKLNETRLREDIEEAKKEVSKEDKIQVIKEWIWYTCDEGQAKDDINKYNKMVDMYFASKDDVTKGDFKNIWNKVIEKWGVGDVGADSEGFYDAWKDIQTGTLVNPGQTYEGKEKEESLNEYEATYVVQNGRCYRITDEGYKDEVDMGYCRREGVYEEKEKVEETVDNRTLMAVEKIQDLLANLKSNTATNSNIPTIDKQGLLGAFQEIEELLEDVGADIEMEMDDRYVPNNSLSEESVRMFKSDNPEGDQLVLRFLKGVAQKFDYPVAQAAMFVKERIKKLGY